MLTQELESWINFTISGEGEYRVGRVVTLFISRYKLEHNQISRSEVDKSEIFDLLNLYLGDPDQEIQHTTLQLIQVRSEDRVMKMRMQNINFSNFHHKQKLGRLEHSMHMKTF